MSTSRPVSRILSRTAIPLGDALLRRSCIATYPELSSLAGCPFGAAAPGQRVPALLPDSFPIWSCSVWGLPCLRRYRRSGALLPHLFTLTSRTLVPGAVCFLWHWPSMSLNAHIPDVIRHTALRSSDFPPPEFALADSGSDRPVLLPVMSVSRISFYTLQCGKRLPGQSGERLLLTGRAPISRAVGAGFFSPALQRGVGNTICVRAP